MATTSRLRETEALLDTVDGMDAEMRARALRAAYVADAIASAVAGIADWFRRRSEAARTYDELSRLDDRALADIGINRALIPAVAAGEFAPEAANENRTVARVA
jgi:uncharacterized protein YjiS (DUF1127 family)